MKKSKILSIAAFPLIFIACNNSSTKNGQTQTTDTIKSESVDSSETFNLDTTKLKSGDVFYQCEMNPEVISDQPNNCPTCGMELSKMNKK